MSQLTLTNDVLDLSPIPCAVQLRGISREEPGRLLQALSAAIVSCGGWMLSRGSSDTGTVTLLFEFERHLCVEIYSVLMAVGIDLTPRGHIRFTELCQCTATSPMPLGQEIVSIDLEVQTVRETYVQNQAHIRA